jgi:hypothetical protein
MNSVDGKKTFGSFISKVKAKMSEFDQSRCAALFFLVVFNGLSKLLTTSSSSQGSDSRWAASQYEQRTHSAYYDPNHPEYEHGYDASPQQPSAGLLD